MAANKLREDDARLVDMLLDSGASSDGNGATNTIFTSPQPEMFNQRLHSIERLLKTLDQLPAAEPPVDLVARTLDFIDEVTTTGRRARPTGAATTGAGARPIA